MTAIRAVVVDDEKPARERLRRLLSKDTRVTVAGCCAGGAEALAAIRTTREAMLRRKGESLPCIVGVPESGERIGSSEFNGEEEAAVFPGDLPENPLKALKGGLEAQVHFVRFRPPVLKAQDALGLGPSFPHIRLDRVLEFLFGDRLT